MAPNLIRTSAREYFYDALGAAMQKESVAVSPITHRYMVQVLVKQVDRGYHPDETLGDKFAAALEARDAERIRMLRDVGDRALVASGLWWEHQYRPRRPSHAKFHIDLGRVAYTALGGVPFDELARNMSGIVDAFIRLGIDHTLASARDILRLYMLWDETHSRCAARALIARGITPLPSVTQTPS